MRLKLALDIMQSAGTDKVRNIQSGKGGKGITTPIYTAYALDMEYLTPLYHTLKERIETFQEEVTPVPIPFNRL